MDHVLVSPTAAAFLALWNDTAADVNEYNAWHTREHVAERLGVPGFLSARRYVRRQGTLPFFFTVYELQSLDVMQSDAYLRIVGNPSPLSQSMRPHMRRFLRRACATRVRLGAGIGGLVAIWLLETGGNIDGLAAALSRRPMNPHFTGWHLGAVAPGITPMPFEEAGPSNGTGFDAIFMIEGHDTPGFESEAEQTLRSLATELTLRLPDVDGVYSLAFALTQGERLSMLPLPPRI